MSVAHFLPTFIYNQLLVKPKVPTTDCTGKTIIVTGANSGLGKEATRHFVRLNAQKVILACRSIEKGEAARKDIEASTRRTGVMEVWQVDMADYESVKTFAQRASTLARVDVLLENAGISTDKYTPLNGNESTITVNVVSTFLLALLMLPKMQETARTLNITPTITIVSSAVQFLAPFTERKEPSIFDAINDPAKARMDERYNLSKLLEVLVCREITREHPIDQMKVTLNFVSPGLCQSELFREASRAQVAALKPLMRTTEMGSRTLVHAGVAGPETNGKYLSECEIKKCAPLVEGKEGPGLQKRVWQELSAKMEKIEPGVTKVLGH